MTDPDDQLTEMEQFRRALAQGCPALDRTLIRTTAS